MMKVVFVSQYEMTEAQRADLRKYLRLGGETELVVEKADVAFAETEDYKADLAANMRTVGALFGEYDAVVGVFPPVAVEALNAIRAELVANPTLGNAEDVAFLVPVGSFEHVRYAYL